MAHTVDEVNVLIKAQTEQFQAEIDRVNQKLNSISKAASTASGGVSGGFKNMGLKMAATGAVIGVVSAVTQKAMAAIASSTGDAVKRFDTLKNFPRVMGNLGISAQDSQASIDYLSNKLEGLPTTLDAATTAVQRFTATNGNLRASTAIYLALNNAILAGGADAQQQASAMEQLQQAYAKGKPEMQDWKTLMQTMPAQLKQIANAMGYMDSSQLYNALQNGKASMDDFMRAAVKLNKEGINGLGSFEQQAAGATGGVATSFMNMQNAIVRGITACMDAIGQSNIAGFFNVVKDVILTAANYVAAFIKLVLTAINAVRALFGLGSIGAKNVASSGGQAANSMANVGKAAQGSTKDIGDTTKAAKKLQKQLAGFDEMNVLSKQDSGGSGGSGKSGGGGSVSHDTSGLEFDNADIAKGVDKVNAIFEKLKSAFKDFNFDKIGKAFKRFGDDIDNFIKPAKKILSDVWDRIKPFIQWTGNELLPAFMNALGGAIRLVGRVLAIVWDAYLKPFIDFFLIPLAKLAGGAIVFFLNGIGDAFRNIANNRGLSEFIVGVSVAIGGLVIAIKAKKALDDLKDGVTTLRSVMLSSPAAYAAVSAKIGALNTAFVLAGGGLYGFKAVLITLATTIKTTFLTTILGAFSAIMAHPLILAGAALIGGIVFIGGSIKSALEQTDSATRQAESSAKALKVANSQLSEATKKVQTAEENLNNARKAVADAGLQQIQAIKDQKQAQDELLKTEREQGLTYQALKSQVDSGALSYQNMTTAQQAVYEAGLKLDSANAQVKLSQDNLTKATDDSTKAAEEHKAAKDEELSALYAGAVAQAVISGKYRNTEEAIKALKNGTLEYKDENGNMVKANVDDIGRLEGETKKKSKEITKAYNESMTGADQGFFGPMARSLAKTGEDIGVFASNASVEFGKFANHAKTKASEAWNGLTSAFSGVANWASDRWNDIVNAFSGAWQAFSDIGKNIWNGLKNGIGNIANNMKNMFTGAVDNVKKFLGIHSPSKLFMGIGDYMSQGMNIGFESNLGDMIKSASELSAEINSKLDFGPNIGSEFDFDIKHSVINEPAEKMQKLPLIVNIDGEEYFNGMVDRLNTQSFLKNASVLDI